MFMQSVFKVTFGLTARKQESLAELFCNGNLITSCCLHVTQLIKVKLTDIFSTSHCRIMPKIKQTVAGI